MTILIAAAAVLAGAPAAIAGTYTWNQPGTFTKSGSGANPDSDAYGAKPWSYLENNGGSTTALPTFSSSIDGGLVGWTDLSNADDVIATTPGSAPVTSGPDTFTSGNLAMSAGGGDAVFLAWTSPFSTSVSNVTISGAIATAESGDLCLGGLYSWKLMQGTTTLASGGGPGTISATVPSLPAGGAIYLEVTNSGSFFYDVNCATAEANLTLSTAVSATPSVTMSAPSNGAVYADPQQPTFSGSASAGFGISPAITVHVYHYTGAAPGGTPVATLSTNAKTSGGTTTWSVAPSPPLPDGTYVAVAQQSDMSNPIDTGFSSQNPEFTIETPSGSTGGTGATGTTGTVTPPAGVVLTLNPFTPTTLTTGQPTFTGSGGTASAGAAVNVLVYSGTTTTGSPVKLYTGTVSSTGSFSITPTSALADGVYTAVASENTAGGTVFSGNVSFLIKANAPAVTIIAPLGGSTLGRQPLFYGQAGNEAGDSGTVTLALYSGAAATGTPFATQTTTRIASGWIMQWPAQLPLGLYTLVAQQTDVAGHTTTTAGRTFLVVPNPPVIGSQMSIAQNGVASVPIYCAAKVNSLCIGVVYMTTVNKVKVGKKRERLTLIQEPVSFYGLTTLVARGRTTAAVRTAFKHTRHVAVKVTAKLALNGGGVQVFTRSGTASIAH